MSYRYNPVVGQKLGYARYFQTQLKATGQAYSNDGVAQHAALEDAITFELINALNAFLSEIADNYGVDPSCSKVDSLISELALRGIVSPEVEEISLSISCDGWISALMKRHQKNCAGSISTKESLAETQPLRFVAPGETGVEELQNSSETGQWLTQLSELIDRHREGLAEW
jgi:hypothetical protein